MAIGGRYTVPLQGIVLLIIVAGSISQQFSERRCHAYDNSCSDCIQTPGCQWCSAFKQVNGSLLHRCYSSAVDSELVCQSDQTTNPRNQHVVTVDEPLTVVTKGRNNNNDIVQLAPQRMRLTLRKGEPYNITFKFRLATDYPVDLYYLMDLSKSMEDDKENLARLGRILAETMRNLTSKFRLGFGSYVDKVVMPYANVHPARIKHPCDGCASPYSFRNDLPLDSDDAKFTYKVRNTPISGNVDAPEGSLDALLQAIVCWEQIGWRRQARRLLILSTDARFHHAGDGRLAGIVQPHDGQCYLNSRGEYTHYDKLDYPSIAQINEAARENQVNIIFAVSSHEQLYKSLSDSIKYSSTGMLDKSSSNVVGLVKDQYNLISSEVKLSDNVESIPGSPVSVRYFSSCRNENQPPRLTSTCTDIKEGNEIEFTAQVEVVSVPDEATRRTLQVNITTFQDTLTLDIEIVAECDCEQPSAPGREPNSAQCSRAGVLQCGVCQCKQGHYGNKCQCSSDRASDSDSSAADAAQCLADPEEAEICSGQGECECGTCICNSASLTGKYCECNEDLCIGGGSSNRGGGASMMSGGGAKRRECSGRGNCDCGICRCHTGWTGQFCDCPDDESCVIPGGYESCSGKGDCDCGQCSCHSIEDVLYTGRYCEECSTCSSGKCQEFRDCVQCRVFGTGQLEGEACNNCTIKPRVLSSLEAEVEAGARLCTFLDETTGCEFNFTYEYRANDQDYFLVVQKAQRCPEALDVLGVVLGVIGGVVAIGLLTLLLWKILTTIHDRREFAKFENERNNVQWGTEKSPIYKEATGTFVNPAFGATQTAK